VELATQAILTNTESCFFMIPLGISTACATRIGQLLGQAQPIAAKRALRVSLGLSLVLTMILIVLALIGQNIWVNIFTSDQDTRELFVRVFPLQILVLVLNAVQGVLSGALRGCGRQMDGAYVNLLSFWGVGFPWVVVCEKFSKVGALVFFLYKITIELTFENFYQFPFTTAATSMIQLWFAF
jgi:MATE family multidrug resistance protein